MATAQKSVAGQRAGFWWTGAIIYIGWNLTTLIGALLGDLVGDVRMYGLDAAAAAAVHPARQRFIDATVKTSIEAGIVGLRLTSPA